MSYHMCVWIDHREARVFSIEHDDAGLTVIADNGPIHHIHRKADHVGLGTEPTDPSFLSDVAKALAAAKAILICGPGKARTELAGYLNEHASATAKRVWGIEPMDHPTDPEIIAAARKYFRAADRMHA
jgi:stalled ribosome rescue protein Dom34